MDTAEILKHYPLWVTRREGAEMLSRHLFQIAPRTLENWDMGWREMNGRAVCKAADLLAEGIHRMENAVPARSRRPQRKTAQ